MSQSPPSKDHPTKSNAKRVRKSKRDQRSRGGLQFLGFICLVLLLILGFDEFHSPNKVFLQNLISVFVLILLTLTLAKSLPRALEKKITPGFGSKEPRKWFIIHSFVTGGAIALLLLWISGGITGSEVARYEALLHGGFLLGLLGFGMALRRVYFWWKIFDITPGRMVFFLYGVVAAMGAVLLILPWSLKETASIKLVDAFFIAVSALTVTGLVPVNVAHTFSMLGQTIIMMLIEVGGVGIVFISVSLVVFTRNRLSLQHSLLGQQEMFNIPNVGGMKPFIGKMLAFTLTAQVIGAFFIYYSLPADLENRFFHTIFHTISAFCSAGFSTFENNLEMPGLPFFKGVVIVLVFLGGIGFHVIIEVMNRVQRTDKKPRLSADSYLTFLVTGIIIFIGTGLIYWSESIGGTYEMDTWERWGQSLFYSAASRTAGFSTVSVTDLSHGSNLVMSLLMIIGGSSLSTAGGIKVTTLGILVIAAVSLFRGNKWIQFGFSFVEAKSPL